MVLENLFLKEINFKKLTCKHSETPVGSTIWRCCNYLLTSLCFILYCIYFDWISSLFYICSDRSRNIQMISHCTKMKKIIQHIILLHNREMINLKSRRTSDRVPVCIKDHDTTSFHSSIVVMHSQRIKLYI